MFLPLLISVFLITVLYFFLLPPIPSLSELTLLSYPKGFLGNEMLALSGMVFVKTLKKKKKLNISTTFLVVFISSCSFPVIHIDNFCPFLNIYVLTRWSILFTELTVICIWYFVLPLPPAVCCSGLCMATLHQELASLCLPTQGEGL